MCSLQQQELPQHVLNLVHLNLTPLSWMVYQYIGRVLKTCSACLDLYISTISRFQDYSYILFFMITLHRKLDLLITDLQYRSTVQIYVQIYSCTRTKFSMSCVLNLVLECLQQSLLWVTAVIVCVYTQLSHSVYSCTHSCLYSCRYYCVCILQYTIQGLRL